MKTKKKLVVRSIAIKEEAKNVLKKDQKNIVYYGRFLRNEHHEGIAMLVQLLKADDMYNILKSSGHCLLVKR